MKKTAILLLVVTCLAFVGCPFLFDQHEYGSLHIAFSFAGSKAVEYLDFTQVSTGTAFLKQGGVTKYSQAFTINPATKTGECTMTEVIIGDYDLRVELYDTAPNVLYFADDTVSIAPGDNGTKIVTLTKNVGTLVISGSWTEEITELDHAIVQLKQSEVVKYGGNLSLNTTAKTVSGGIDHIFPPGEYVVYIEIRNVEGTALFTGSQPKVIDAGENSVSVTLEPVTGSVVITTGGDVTAPQISSGPSVSVDGSNVTVTWTTNENATSNVCYSETSGFNYQTQTNWAPVGRDISADNTSHAVTIIGLADGACYYVVVSADASGNMTVGDEGSSIVGIPTSTVPAGSFQMGWGGIAEPVHTVTLSAFEIAKYEVFYKLWYTVRTWAEVNGYTFQNLGREGHNGEDGVAPSAAKDEPVTYIDWRDAIAWCNALSEMKDLTPCYYNSGQTHVTANVYRNSSSGGDIGNTDVEWSANGYRLPTEAEWEYVARYVDGTTFTQGDWPSGATGYGQEEGFAWYDSNSGSSSHAVGQKAANALGAYDMSGNVFEWCWDWYASYGSSAQTDPVGPTSGSQRVVRGGSWEYSAGYLQVAHRHAFTPWPAYYYFGFRLVRTGP